MTEKEHQKLNEYLKAKLGVNIQQLPNHQVILKKDMVALITLTLEDYPILANYPLRIKKGTKLKIMNFVNMEPLGYSNYLFIEIINSPVEFKELRVVLEKLVEATR